MRASRLEPRSPVQYDTEDEARLSSDTRKLPRHKYVSVAHAVSEYLRLQLTAEGTSSTQSLREQSIRMDAQVDPGSQDRVLGRLRDLAATFRAAAERVERRKWKAWRLIRAQQMSRREAAQQLRRWVLSELADANPVIREVVDSAVGWDAVLDHAGVSKSLIHEWAREVDRIVADELDERDLLVESWQEPRSDVRAWRDDEAAKD